MPEKADYTLKILTIGESGVGKTCILIQFLDGKFIKHHLTTIGIDFKTKHIDLENNKSVKLKIWDTAGQERFQNITQQYYKNADGILLVFDVTDRNSFEKTRDWMKQIQANTQKDDIGIILVGNKTDLTDERQVSEPEGIKLAQEFGIKYFETSACKGVNIHECFAYLAQSIISKQKTSNEDPEDKKIHLEENKSDGKGSKGGKKDKKGCC